MHILLMRLVISFHKYDGRHSMKRDFMLSQSWLGAWVFWEDLQETETRLQHPLGFGENTMVSCRFLPSTN